jgi:hypothetical protein
MGRSKGFIFSMDAILAVVLLMMFLIAFSFFSSRALENPYTLLVLQKQADDAVIVLDKTGTLGMMDRDDIEKELDNILIRSLAWNMHMEYYNYSGGIVPAGNFTFGSDYSEADQVVVAERMFVVFDQNTSYGAAKPVKYYGLARLRLWTE